MKSNSAEARPANTVINALMTSMLEAELVSLANRIETEMIEFERTIARFREQLARLQRRGQLQLKLKIEDENDEYSTHQEA
jgi:hypothetical protein